MRTRFVVSALLFAAGCNWGTRPVDFAPANGPQGARVAARVRGEDYDRLGELLAVDSTGITIRTNVVTLIAWTRLAALDVDGLGNDYDVRAGEVVGNNKIARLSLVSRFPQGIKHLPISLDSLIATTERRTTRFADRRVAVEEGYRRVGADFPGMGEHWINVHSLLGNRIDPSLPTLLTYAMISGRPTLLGVGFVVVTRADSTPDVPGWPTEWHEHSGLLADESGAAIEPAKSDSPTHVWVMHVWTKLENPAGQLSADNWSLPFRRAGVAIPRAFDSNAGRGAALAVGGDVFLRDALTDAALRTPANSAVVDSIIASAHARATSSLGAEPNVAELESTWSDLSAALEQAMGPRVRAILVPAHDRLHRGDHR